MHAVRLINEVINNRKEIRDKLLLAYLVGIPVKNSLKSFQPCNGESDVNCFMSWNTFGDNVNHTITNIIQILWPQIQFHSIPKEPQVAWVIIKVC